MAEAEMGPITPTLSDGVVVLDSRRFDDLAERFVGQDEALASRLGWYATSTTADTVGAAIQSWREAWRTHGRVRAFAVRDAQTGEPIGQCELRLLGDEIADLSYMIFSACRGRGFATRAVRLATTYGFRELRVRRIELSIEADNLASRHVARRAGFLPKKMARGQGRGREEGRDVLTYCLNAPSDE